MGRGVLLDYLSWAQSQGIQYSPVSRHCITVKELEAVAVDSGVEILQGDILLVRTGFVEWHNNASPSEQRKGTEQGGNWAGVEGSEECLQWFWDKHFAAVGGDAIVFEAWPPTDERYREFNPSLL